MIEMYEMPEPDLPNTPEQLWQVARTYYYEQLMLMGMEPTEIDGLWERMPKGQQLTWINKVRASVNTANAHWGRRVREHQARLLKDKGGIEEIIRNNWDPAEAAKEIARLLELPR